MTGFVNMAYQYNPKNLEPEVAALGESVLRQYGNETVVELAARYLGGLNQVFKSGKRRGRFTPSNRPAETPPRQWDHPHRGAAPKGMCPRETP
ncbi:MAG: hypothetical protein ACYCX6_01605 [Vulcanimicrobiaceae bacterium]